MSIQPLIDDKSVCLLQEGLGFLYSYTLEEHKKYLPNKYSRSYKPFALYDENPSDPIAKTFIKTGGVYFPQDDFDTYISLLGGSIADISFVLDNFQDKRLILNETENSLYGVLLSLRDNPEETIDVYKKLVGYYCKASTSKEASISYKKIKECLYESLGCNRLYENCGFLLFLLHTGCYGSSLIGIKAKEFYCKKVDTLWEWHKVLSSSKVSLYHTDDYRSIPLPSDSRNFIVANTPEYVVGCVSSWSPEKVKHFCKYFSDINDNTDSFLLASSNISPMFRSHFTSNKGWNTYKVVTNTKYSPLFYDEKNHRKNMDRCFCSNYKLNLPVTELTPANNTHTKEFISLYEDYCSGLV